jgi:hypothetical protein
MKSCCGTSAALLAAAEESDGNPSHFRTDPRDHAAADTGPHTLLTLALYAPDEKSDPATAQDLAGFAVVVEEPDGTAACWKSQSTPATGTRAWRTGSLASTQVLARPRRAQGLVARQP